MNTNPPVWESEIGAPDRLNFWINDTPTIRGVFYCGEESELNRVNSEDARRCVPGIEEGTDPRDLVSSTGLVVGHHVPSLQWQQ